MSLFVAVVAVLWCVVAHQSICSSADLVSTADIYSSANCLMLVGDTDPPDASVGGFNSSTCVGVFGMHIIVDCSSIAGESIISLYLIVSDTTCSNAQYSAYIDAATHCAFFPDLFMSIVVTGCVNNTVCSTTAGAWSSWSTTCGAATRSRTIQSVLNDGLNTTCTPSNNSLLYPTSYRFNVCDGLTTSSFEDVCDIAIKTCYLIPGNDAPFNTFDSFLVGSPMFTSGWTLLVSEFTKNCSIMAQHHCESTEYIQPVIVTSLSNLTIRPMNSYHKIRIKVMQAASLNSSVNDPRCGAFVFTGDNVQISGMVITIDDGCYTFITPEKSGVMHGTAVRFTGQDAIMSDISIVNAVVGIALTPVVGLQKIKVNDAGNVYLTDILVSGSRPVNQYGGHVAACWAVMLVAGAANVSAQSLDPSCVISFIPSEATTISTNMQILDMSPSFVPLTIVDPTIQQKHVPQKTNNLLRTILYIAVGVAFVLSIAVIWIWLGYSLPDEVHSALDYKKNS